ncbi:MAG: hypothetical protein HYT80_08045 [Euryarchaeota archaeon]|nr:hypothetical protein [Euryarchaeota archaeon]
MPGPSKKPDLKKLLELWVDSSLKVQVVVFFHDNPGIIETLEGLAKRLGTNVDHLRKEIAGHISLGILRQQKTDGMTLLVYDRRKEADVQRFIEHEMSKRTAEASAR